MHQKTWLHRRNGEAEISVNGNNEEKLPCGKEVALKETVKNLHEQIVCLLCECNMKDKLVTEHTKAAEEANLGREKAEALVAISKQELEAVLQQKVAANEKSVHLTAALKNCRKQLSCLKIEQVQRENLEIAHKRLESKYIEARKKLTNLAVENARLTKCLVKRDGIIENVGISRLHYNERNRPAGVANRQQLEAQRQKLRLLVRKRIPGNPKTKSKNHPRAVDIRMSLMIKQLCEVEEENKILKENSFKKENKIHLLKAELARISCDKHKNSNFDRSMEKYATDSVDTQSLNKDNIDIKTKLLDSEKKIASLKTKLESLKDNLENLKLINYDLDHQLSTAKDETKQALQKVSFLEMELEDKSNYYEGLEATCLDLHLQLTSKDVVTEDLKQDEKLLQTGLAADHGVGRKVFLNLPMIKEILNIKETKEPSVTCYDTCNTSCKVVPRALSIIPSKKRAKGTSLLRRLLFRGKRQCSKKKLSGIAVYKI